MRVAIFLLAIMALVLAAAALPMSAPAEAGAPPARPHTVASAHGMTDTVAALEQALRRRGFDTVVKVDQPRAGQSTATLVMFADPTLEASQSGYALDQFEPRLRALVYADPDGVKIAFDDAKILARRAGLDLGQAMQANRILAEAAAEAAAKS